MRPACTNRVHHRRVDPCASGRYALQEVLVLSTFDFSYHRQLIGRLFESVGALLVQPRRVLLKPKLFLELSEVLLFGFLQALF